MERADDKRAFFVGESADRSIPIATAMDWVGYDEMKMVMCYHILGDEAAPEAMRAFWAGEALKRSWPTPAAGCDGIEQ